MRIHCSKCILKNTNYKKQQIMAFTIEFQPQGFRLKCDRPINALDAALQAGIHLNAVCGGEGICGKCVIQILSDSINFPISK